MNTLTKRYGRKDNTPAPPAAPAAPASSTPPADNQVTEKELHDAVAKAVTEALKGQSTPLDGEAIRKIVADELSKQSKDSKTIDEKSLSAAIGAAVQTAVEAGTRTARKNVREGADAGTRDQIEIPYSWSKGNLPLHAKQLLNILSNPNVSGEAVMNKGIDQKDIDRGVQLGEKMIHQYRSMAQRGQKAIMTSTGSNVGDEFVPTDLSAELQRRFYLSSDLAAVVAGREIDMPSQPYMWPLVTTRPTFYLESTEGSGTTGSIPATGNITLSAAKFMGQVSYSYELDEDSIIPVLNTIQTLLSEAAAAAYESCLINGDITGTHMDSDTQTVAKAAERGFAGLRKLALAGSTATSVSLASGGLNEANLRAMKKMMKKYGLRVRDLVWIVGPSGKNDMEAITNVSTLEKYGPKATILTGELSSFLNIPIIGSEAVREDLNASGVYDNSTKTKGSIILANLNYFLPGRRRAFTVESFRDVKLQQNDIVASFRKAWVPIETPSATVPTVILGFNYTA